jgi:hypothetical protein
MELGGAAPTGLGGAELRGQVAAHAQVLKETLMARIRPLTKDEVTGDLRDVLAASERRMGQAPPSIGIQAYAPPILEASRLLGAAPAKSGLLSAQLRSLVCLRAAELVGCPF